MTQSTPLGTVAFQDANNVAITGGAARLAGGTVATAPISATDTNAATHADAVGSRFTFKAACYAAAASHSHL